MKTLAYKHTLNDERIIERCIQAVLDQTRPVDAIVLVENASTDGTLKREFPEILEVVRHERNLGTSGAVRTGIQYAIENGFDWTWLLYSDSAPRADCLERLISHYEQMGPTEQDRVMFTSGLPVNYGSGREFKGIHFTESGV